MKYLMILIIALSSCQTLRHTDADAYDDAAPGEPTVRVAKGDGHSGFAVFLKNLGGSMQAAPRPVNCITTAMGQMLNTNCQ